MQYPFTDIDDFEDIEINDIPAMYTNCRIDRNTIPVGLYAYDIRSGDDEPHATIEEIVGADHQATIITMEEIPMTAGDHTPVQDINFINEYNNSLSDWKEHILEELAESGEWKERAITILEAHTNAHIGDITSFVEEYWQNLNTDEKNLREFYNQITQQIKENIGDPKNLERCHITKGMPVYWKDPAGETSGLYITNDNFLFEVEDEEENILPDDRIIDITYGYSEAQVYPCELYPIGKKALARKTRDGSITLLFLETVIDADNEIHCCYNESSFIEMPLSRFIEQKLVCTPNEYAPVINELIEMGIGSMNTVLMFPSTYSMTSIRNSITTGI